MFEIGEVVIYTTYGICKIEDKITKQFNGTDTEYYILKPLANERSSLSIPVHHEMTKIKLHHLLAKEEVQALIDQIPFLEPYWIVNDNERKKQFSDIIRIGNQKELLLVLKSIRAHNTTLKDKNRKLHATDEATYKDALKLIVDEFSYVLELPREQILELVIID